MSFGDEIQSLVKSSTKGPQSAPAPPELTEAASAMPETDEHIPATALDSISMVLESLAAWDRKMQKKG